MPSLGRGRPAKKRSIGEITELTAEDLAEIDAVREKPPAFAHYRDTYHAVARLIALGLRPEEVALRSGYGLGRISQFTNDPAFQGMVAVYREQVDKGYLKEADEYFHLVNYNRNIAERTLNDRLINNPEDFTNRDLNAIAADRADRTGYGKKATQIIQADLTDRLAQAIAATGKIIDGRAIRVIENAREDKVYCNEAGSKAPRDERAA
jgi:hypothetical protein